MDGSNMKVNWDRCLTELLKIEGGYVNHPEDPGGRTNLGVTQRTWEAWVGRAVTEEEMMSLTKEDVGPLYMANYWTPMKCSIMYSGLDFVLFDMAVNAGPGRTTKIIQEVVGATVDGDFGPETEESIHAYEGIYGVKHLIERFQEERLNFYKSLSTFKTFGRGWTRRVEKSTEFALGMV